MGLKCNKNSGAAEIEQGTRLYRVTMSAYTDKKNLLSGKGGIFSEGRYNYIHQLTSYATDNVLVCISEMLFHMYNVSMKKLNNQNYSDFQAECSKIYELVVFKTKKIDNLIYLDSNPACQKYQVTPSAITHSDTTYEILQRAANVIRNNNSYGIVTPSARHSRGNIVVLFKDCTRYIDTIEHKFKLTLSLLSENLNYTANNSNFVSTIDRLSQNVGQYEFVYTDLQRYISLLNPTITKSKGKIDFARRIYPANIQNKPYPDIAIII